MNTTLRAAVALLAMIACAGLLVACGGSSSGAQALLEETFSGHTQIERGRINLSFSLSPIGSNAASKPLSVTLDGPFESTEPRKLPRFALGLSLNSAGQTLNAGATATGTGLYVQLAGTWYATPQATYKALEEGYARATKSASGAKVRSTFSSLGVEPARWLSNPAEAGTTRIDGVEVVHLTASVNVPAFLADVTKLSQAGTSLGLGSVPGTGGSLSPTVISQLAKSIKSAHVDVYTGHGDHLLRRLEVTATVAATGQTQSLIGGLTNANVKLLLEFSDLNQPQSITAPSNPRAATELLPALQQLSGVLGGATGG